MGITAAVLLLVAGIVAGSIALGYPQMSPVGEFSWSQYDPPTPVAPSRGLVAEGKNLYLLNCAVCHGDSGQGNGWRAMFLYPKPRNFTRGIYRFKTTESGTLPTDRDLFRTVSVGLQGTAMPAWANWLSEGDRWAIIAYIKTLYRFYGEETPGTPITLGKEPEFTAARIERGRSLYTTAGCVECHGTTGHGNGVAAADMEDSFGVAITPRNFHIEQQFKRGRTMRDIALTVATGNDGSPMPAFNQALSKAQIWDLAAYVMSLDLETPTLQNRGCPMMAARKE